MWLHSSPTWIVPGKYALPAAELDIPSRSFPVGVKEAIAMGWYNPHRAYVWWSDVEPHNHIGRWAFTRSDHYMYEVEPEDLGDDKDIGACSGQWRSCARALVLRCVHEPEPVEVVDLV
jgi:hypothetical protein